MFNVLQQAGPGWTLMLLAQEGELAETLRSVVAAARLRGMHILHRPQPCDTETGPAAAAAPRRKAWVLLVTPPGLVENEANLDATATDTLAHAVREILPVSSQAAVKLADRLLDKLDSPDPSLAPHLVTVVDAHLADGRLAGAGTLLRETLLRPLPDHVAAELRTRLVHVLVAGGRIAEAITVAQAAPPEQGRHDGGHDDARAALAFALYLRDPERAALQAAEPALPGAAAVTASALAGGAWRRGDAARATQLARQAVTIAGEGASPVWRMLVRLAYARKLMSGGRYTEAEGHIEQATSELSHPGAPSVYAPAPAIARAELLMRTGDLEQALELAEAALRSAREMDAALLLPLSHAVLAEASLRIGDLDRSRWHAEAPAKLRWAGRPSLWPVHPEWIRVRIAAELHGPQHAARLFAAAHTDLAAYGPLLLDDPGTAVWLTRLGIAAGDDGLTDQIRTAVEALARRNVQAHRLSVAARHARGLRENDVTALRRAAAEHSDLWDQAGALEDLGARLAAPPAADLIEATRHYQSALCLFERIGTVRDSERVRGRLRRLGQEPVPLRQGPALWRGFSETECLIALLVSQGLTNHQIAGRISLSAHTVNYHLRKMFRKVSVNSRVELARLVNEAGRDSLALPFVPRALP
ncbi:LuxR C-terminal-related transcriptional regulator [Nonomuraea sp. NPDC050404]|uniref:LuxR C-terminal-related transcriptional regulator n=1 Tax=Nonomuraea sp. NPDC050404 TaxID=3155783 RepID=UPI0033C7D38E